MKTKLNHVHNWLELARKANWSVKEVAKLCKVSVRALELHFHKTKNETPKAWMAKQRQQLAMELLGNGDLVKETAAKLGYKHANHFSREFKKLHGCYPTQTHFETSKLRILV